MGTTAHATPMTGIPNTTDLTYPKLFSQSHSKAQNIFRVNMYNPENIYPRPYFMSGCLFYFILAIP